MAPYRITEVGFDQREAVFLRTTIEMASSYEVAEWLWVGGRDADVILVNTDREEFAAEFISDKSSSSNFRTILIGCSSNDKMRDSFSYTLKKPISYSVITTLLLELEIELALSAVEETSSPITEEEEEIGQEEGATLSLNKQMFIGEGSQPEIGHVSTSLPIGDDQLQSTPHIPVDEDSDYDVYDLLMDSEFDHFQSEGSKKPSSTPQQVKDKQSEKTGKSRWIEVYRKMSRPPRRFHENKYFLGLIRKLVLVGDPTEISHFIYPSVRIYPDQQIFAHKSCYGLSPELFSARAFGFSNHELIKPDEQVPPEGWDARPLWLLFYLAALYGSGGRLMENNTTEDRLSLTSEPDFEVVPHDLDYRKIADYMMTIESQDIQKIADGAGVNVKTVIDFCNACQEIDLIDRTPSAHSEAELSTEISVNETPKVLMFGKAEVVKKGMLNSFISKLKDAG